MWCFLTNLELPYEVLKKQDVYARAETMLTFWKEHDCFNNSKFWKEALDIARIEEESDDQYKQLRNHIDSLFLMNKFDYYDKFRL